MWITFSEFIFFSENKIFTFVNANISYTHYHKIPNSKEKKQKNVDNFFCFTFLIRTLSNWLIISA